MPNDLHSILRVRLFTAGSPRVGNADYATWAKQVLYENWRMTHYRDPVVHLPPEYVYHPSS